MGMIGALWGLMGVILLLGSAVYRLTPLAVQAFTYEMLWYHWVFLALVLFFMAYAEGYRAFQKGFSPRVAARARYLRTHRNNLHLILAPLFCMGYFHAPKRRRVTSISVTLGIIALVILVRLLPQPWRGIVDAGVVVGLAWGLISLLIFAAQAFRAQEFPYAPEVPEEKLSEANELP
ncbi:MAG TPA: hypothetical protein VEM40_14195 [Nitrospirota bacterium]|nr:hypothetical protein [Nitrospirota bacterium]